MIDCSTIVLYIVKKKKKKEMHNRNPYHENYKALMKDIKKISLKEGINRFLCGVTKIEKKWQCSTKLCISTMLVE